MTRSYGSSIFNFLRKLHTVVGLFLRKMELCFTVTTPVYIPSNSVRGLPFLQVILTLLIY